MKRSGGLLMILVLCCCGSWVNVFGESGFGQQAPVLAQAGSLEAAIRSWKLALKQNPDNLEALSNLGMDEFRLGDYRAAAIAYGKAVKLDPQATSVRMNLGVSLFKATQFKQAATVFAEMGKQQPDNERLIILAGMSYYGAKEYAKAVPYLREAANEQPKNVALRLPLANSCLWAKQYQCVLTVYKQILALNGNSAQADMLAGEALSAEDQASGAIRQFRDAVKANPKEPEVHFGLGYLLWTQGDYPEAEKEFRAELVNDPTDAKSLTYLGDTLLHLHQPQLARKALVEALRLNPSSELAYVDLGALDTAAGNRQLAVNDYKRAIAIDPKNTTPYWKLGRLEVSMGYRQEAQADFAKLSKLHQQANQQLYLKMAGSPMARAAEAKKKQKQ